MKKILMISFLFLLVSCNNQKPFEKRIHKVFEGPVFRDLTIGDSYNKVLKTENKNFMQFPDSNMIKYMWHVSDSEEYHWAYIFEQDKIKQIHFDAYLGQEEDGGIYTKLVQKKYDKILGPSTNNQGLISWQKDGIKAALLDQSYEAHLGKIKLFIYSVSDSSVSASNPFSGAI